MRQSVCWSTYIPNGTRRSPPAEAPAVLRLSTVARFRWDQRDSRALVVVREVPLQAIDMITPKTRMRKSIWKVVVRRTVVTPNVAKLARRTLRAPRVSNSRAHEGVD